MELQVATRKIEKKRDARRLRREGKIPAVLYGPGVEPEGLVVDRTEWEGNLRQLPKGQLSTALFELKGGEGKRRALVKAIQYHPTTYDVLHLDFIEVQDDRRVNVKVPITFTGAEECVGLKQGGVLRPVIRYLRINCLPGAIPKEVTINVSDLSLNHSKTLGAIALPEGVRALDKLSEVAVVVVKR